MTLITTAVLRLKTGPGAGKTYELRRTLRVGRHPYNEISLDDAAASRYHCWITVREDGAFIEDLASTNGTFVNGARVETRKPLRPGDLVRVGQTEFLFTDGE